VAAIGALLHLQTATSITTTTTTTSFWGTVQSHSSGCRYNDSSSSSSTAEASVSVPETTITATFGYFWFLADDIDTQYEWHHNVSLSACLSVTLCIVALSVSAEGCAVVFLGGNFQLTSTDTFAVGCIV